MRECYNSAAELVTRKIAILCFPMHDYKNDSRYKRYETAIDRNLASFETISEWADIIAFLSRLNKVLFPGVGLCQAHRMTVVMVPAP